MGGQRPRPGRATLLALAATMLVAGCAGATPAGTPAAPSTTPTALPAGTADPGDAATRPVSDTVPACADVDWLMADEAAYGPEPMIAGLDDEVDAWARQFDDLEDIWGHLDRPGRLTLGFRGDHVADRQAALREDFPGGNVAAVAVPVARAELDALRTQVMQESGDLVAEAGGGVHMGVVAVDLAVRPLLERSVDDVVAELAAGFPGEPLCVRVPADVPTAGPQSDGGDGWRLLASARGAGEPFTTAIAADPSSWIDLWSSTMGDDPLPDVDFTTEVAVLFGDAHSGSCDHLRLDDVVVTGEVVHMDRVVLDGPICTADANPWAWFVAVDRDVLPDAPFTIQLEEEVPPGVADQVTRVTPEALADGG